MAAHPNAELYLSCTIGVGVGSAPLFAMAVQPGMMLHNMGTSRRSTPSQGEVFHCKTCTLTGKMFAPLQVTGACLELPLSSSMSQHMLEVFLVANLLTGGTRCRLRDAVALPPTSCGHASLGVQAPVLAGTPLGWIAFGLHGADSFPPAFLFRLLRLFGFADFIRCVRKGAVNLSIDTLNTGHTAAVLILLGYLFALCATGRFLQVSGLSLRPSSQAHREQWGSGGPRS